LRKESRWVRNPRTSSITTGEVVVVSLRVSASEPASLFSLTPSLNFFFFSIGRNSERKVTSSSGALPEMVELMICSAVAEDSKG
jgi:hypothetical protein